MSLRPRELNFNEVWYNLAETIKGVITLNRLKKVDRVTWNDKFSDVYQLCVAHPGPYMKELYEETKKFLEDHVKSLHISLMQNNENLLNLYYVYWQEYSKGSEYLNSLYNYLNTQYVKKNYSEADLQFGSVVDNIGENLLDIGELALDCWRKYMIEEFKDKLVKLILTEIYNDRIGKSVNQKVLHGVINSLVDVADKRRKPLELYEILFEKLFIEQTGEYYRQEASKLLEENNCSSYMEKALARLNEENLRSRKFLNPSSYTKVNQECQNRLLKDYLQFLHSECKELVKNEIKHDLKNMYKLLKPIANGINLLVEEVQHHITEIGLETVKELKGDNIPQQFVDSMLQIHQKYSEFIKEIFQNDQEFVGALDKACALAINFKVNKQPCKSPELLAKYCDMLLRKSSKEYTENEIDDKLSNCITIFKYLDDKDYFQRFYWKMMARRLINSLSFSMYAEENMINRLRQVCGYEFTNKFHRMFTDINLSQDLNEKFLQYCKENSDIQLGIDFSILVLQAGAWPFSQTNMPRFSLPLELEKSVRTLEMFYNKSYSGRKLTWMHNISNAEVRLTYLKKQYFVSMSTFQMAILLCFNNNDKLTIKEIEEQIQLPDKELVKQIQSLIESKLIQTTTNEQNLDETSIITLNYDYSNKRLKFKITSAVQKDTPQETESTQTSVDEDRKLYLQAAIVRIMKSRKQLNHNLLIQEVINQSKQRFNPSISLIKKCIEQLIDKQYIERTKNKDEYSYIA